MLVNYCTLDNLKLCKMYSLIQLFYCKRVFLINYYLFYFIFIYVGSHKVLL